MKKLLLIPALLLSASSLVMAEKSKYEITPMIGYNISEGVINIKDNGYPVVGLELQANSANSNWSPELSILYSIGAEYDVAPGKTDMLRIATNAVYTFDTDKAIKPFTKIGIGYEDVSQEVVTNESEIFVDVGLGTKIPFTDALALKLEAIYMLKDIGGKNDSNLAIMAGLTYAFGDIGQKPAPVVVKKEVVVKKVIVLDDDKDGIENSQDRCPTTPRGKKVDYDGCCIDLDDDKDGVLNSKDRCPNTPLGDRVNAKGCSLDLDDDSDGVLNSKDICKNTPLNDAVNSDGCSKSVNLHINFENNSYVVDSASDVRVQEYADFLSTYTNYSAKIVGYTDSRGSAAYNQKLSQNRANAVKNLLIQKGAPASSVTSAGMGEANPVADNNTGRGRAQNRRIEAEMTKH